MKYEVIRSVNGEEEVFLTTKNLDDAKKKAFKLVQIELIDRRGTNHRESLGFTTIKLNQDVTISVRAEDGTEPYKTKFARN